MQRWKAMSSKIKTGNAMEQIVLLRPNMKYAWQVMEFKSEMQLTHDSFDGCAGLEECSSFDEWLQDSRG